MRIFFRKYKILLILLLFIIITSGIIIIRSNLYEDYWVKLYSCNNDFHYNLITFNSVIAGFLFSGISILVSLISNPSIKRLWDNGYLDGLYRSGGIGIFMSVISIIMAFITVLNVIGINNTVFIRIWTIIEIMLAIGSLILFLYCVEELMFSITTLRKSNKQK